MFRVAFKIMGCPPSSAHVRPLILLKNKNSPTHEAKLQVSNIQASTFAKAMAGQARETSSNGRQFGGSQNGVLAKMEICKKGCKSIKIKPNQTMKNDARLEALGIGARWRSEPERVGWQARRASPCTRLRQDRGDCPPYLADVSVWRLTDVVQASPGESSLHVAM
jgi:hypothetical protein